MLEYAKKFVPKKLTAKATTPPTSADATPAADALRSPVLSPSDEKFLEKHLKSVAEEPPVVVLDGGSETPSVRDNTPTPVGTPVEGVSKNDANKEKEKGEWKDALSTRWEGLRRTVSSAAATKRAKSRSKSRDKGKGKEKEASEPSTPVVTSPTPEQQESGKKDKGKGKEKEPEVEEDELTAALERLNLAAESGHVFSISAETSALLNRFTQILKDLINGVPTAYDDLTSFLDSSSKQLEETFTNLPSFLQKLIKTLPTKMSQNLSPEILRAAAAAAPAAAAEGGISIPALKELVTKPGLLMGLLKSVLNVLKTRFPALLGANAALSMGLFVVLLVLWYCYKRGREVRLEQEASISGEGSSGAVPMLDEGPGPSGARSGAGSEPIMVDMEGKKVV